MPLPHSRVYADWQAPSPWAFCDRCGNCVFREELQWQLQWAGMSLVNTHLLVCPTCLDIPNDQLRTIIIGPDPVPVKDPRPGFQAQEQGSGGVTDIRSLIGD